MAPDARTFLALQTSSINQTTDSPYIPRDDESEVKLNSAQGVGETLYLDEEDVRGYAMDGFMEINPDDLVVPRAHQS